MRETSLENLITRSERLAEQNYSTYFVRVILVSLLGFLILGFAILMALIPLALLIGLVALTFVAGGAVLLILLKLGKLLILMILPAFLMLKASFKVLFSRFDKPVGTELTPAQAPALWQKIKSLETALAGPKISHVLLTHDINAAIIQYPRFGLFGWETNYLMLGLPLLQGLTEGEAMAVIAHEYGHLSGDHSRWSGFIYRLRSTWARLHDMASGWRDWGSRYVAKMFGWYAPYFNAYSFVLARKNEYQADHVSVKIAGVENTASALLRVHVLYQLEKECLHAHIQQRVATEPTPMQDKSAVWQSIVNQTLAPDTLHRYIDLAYTYETNHLDTHPAIKDRLKAIGVELETLKTLPRADNSTSAADAWLGAELPHFTHKLDQEWQSSIEQNWSARHQDIQAQTTTLNELLAKETLSADEQWQVIAIKEDLTPDEPQRSAIEAFVQQYPEHLQGRYRVGVYKLLDDDETGIDDLEYVMAQDESAILAACEQAYHYYAAKNPARADEYLQRYQARANKLQAIHQELSTLTPAATLAQHDLDDATVQQIRAVIASDAKDIKRVYLLKRVLDADNTKGDYLLAFEMPTFSLTDPSKKVIERLVSKEFPIHLFIVSLKSGAFKPFKKRIKKLGVEPIYERR